MSSCACKPPTSHSFRVVVGDAIKRRDPTQTGDLRRKFRTDIGNRIRVLKRLLRSALVTHDILGFSSVTVNTISALANAPASSQISGVRGAATGSNKLDAFQNWLWTAIGEVFIGRPGTQSWTASYIRAAYDKGWMRAQTLSGQLLAPDHDRLDTLVNMTYSELEGIADVMYQQANRELTNAMLNSVRAPQMYNAIAARLDAIGATRGRAMAATMVVRAYSEATLDGYAAAGLAKVGVVAETKPKGVVKDAMTMLFDASKKRKGKTKKAKAAAPDEAFPEEVDVLTAGDDLVCPICEDIANSGPYDILDARGLIPAHPNCRCAFIPAFDLRFAGDELVNDDGPVDEARGPDGKWTGGGSSAGSAAVKSGGKKGLVYLFEKAKALRKEFKATYDPVKRAELKAELIEVMKQQHAGYFAKGNHGAAIAIADKLKPHGVHIDTSVSVKAVQAVGLGAHGDKPIFSPADLGKINGPTGTKFTPSEIAEIKAANQAASHGQFGPGESGKAGMLTSHELHHLKNYTGSGYREVNAALRKGEVGESLMQRVNAINAGLSKLPSYHGQVTRFAQLKPEQWAKYEVGKTVEEQGFTSSSRRTDWGWSGGTKFIIQSKNGKDVSHLSHHPGEKEVLFRSNTRFRVTHRDGKVVHMEEVGHGA
jgi:hypothetical protein